MVAVGQEVLGDALELKDNMSSNDDGGNEVIIGDEKPNISSSEPPIMKMKIQMMVDKKVMMGILISTWRCRYISYLHPRFMRELLTVFLLFRSKCL